MFKLLKSSNKDHKCFILTHQEKLDTNIRSNNKQKIGYIFFDYEFMVETRHIPYLVIYRKICNAYINEWININI